MYSEQEDDIAMSPVDERKYHATRQRVSELESLGWSITGRDPLILERASNRLEVRPNGIIIEA